LTQKLSPYLRQQGIHFQIILGGDNPNIPNTNSTKNLGYIAEFKDFFRQIDVLAVPLQSGSGSRLKILESLSFGVPVISTPVGAEGIDIKSPYLHIINDHNNPKSWTISLTTINSKITNQDSLDLQHQLQKYLWTNTLKPLLSLVFEININ